MTMEKGPEDEPRLVSCPAEVKEVFGGEKPIDGEGVPVPTLDDAIEHARQVATMLEDENPACAAQHTQLAEWLGELKYRRQEVSGLVGSLDKLRQRFREFQRDAAPSMDENVHIRMEISQFDKRWMNAKEVSKYVLEHLRMGEQTLLFDLGEQLLRETIGGWLIEKQRRPWEP